MPFDQNTRTLIATFKDYSTAQQAQQELQKEGFTADQIKIDSNQKTAGAGSAPGYEAKSQSGEQESGISGWWNSLFGSDHDEEGKAGYEGALAGGSTILRATVPAGSVDKVADILNQYGAIGVDRTSESAATQTKAAMSTGNSAPIQVIEEQLQVGKRAVQRGGVRVYSHIVSTPVEEQISLREEHVNVARRQVDREISPDEISALRDQTIEVTEMAEEPVVAKRARVREEVLVGKESTERTETIRDNVRHTEVEVEQLEGESQHAGTSSASTTKATGLSPRTPTPGVKSSGAGTAGSGTLAGETGKS